jgi:hypothetical protein
MRLMLCTRRTFAESMKAYQSQDGTTLQAVDVQFASLNEPPFWYITFCDESQILGIPETFDVVQPDLNTI